MRRFLQVLLCLVLSLAASAVPAAATEDLDRCGAITVSERPRLGQRGNWDSRPYARRHNRFLRTRPRVFASGYLAGKHFYVGFTEDVCANLRDFRKGLPQPWRVRAFKAKFNYRRLRKAQRCVAELMGNERLSVSAVGADVYRNMTSVMLERNTKRRRTIIRERCGASRAQILYFEEGTVEPL